MHIEKDDLIDEIKMYLNHITIAHDYFMAYKTLIDAINSDAFNEKVNCAPAFFSVTLNSLSTSLEIELSKLYCDTHKDEKTLLKLINKVQTNAKLFPNEIKCGANDEDCDTYKFKEKTVMIDINKEILQAQEDIKKLEPIISNLNLRRDKKIAHNDKKYFLLPKKIYVDSPMTTRDFHSLIHFAGKLCNKLLCYLNGSVVGYNSLHTEDLKDLLIKVTM